MGDSTLILKTAMSVNIYANASLKIKYVEKVAVAFGFFRSKCRKSSCVDFSATFYQVIFSICTRKCWFQKLDRLTDKISDMKENCWAKC